MSLRNNSHASEKTRNKLSKFPTGEDVILDSWKNINNHSKFRFRRYKTLSFERSLVAVFLGKIVKVCHLLALPQNEADFFVFRETSEELLARNMVFTAYIFKEDYDRLTKQEFIHASQNQKGGSLFGQWTSTGNPVIHRALSFGHDRSSRHEVARNLKEGFQVDYIGEWRPVQPYEHNAVKAREHLWSAREVAPARFLVLDVSKTGIVPFLLSRQGEQNGVLEKLAGENPFNRRDVFRQSQSMVNYNNPPRHVNEARGAVAEQHWRQDPPQNQEAYTPTYQWYSGELGNSQLQNVFGKLQEIAMQGKVEMSRDRNSQDITLSFTGKRHARKWEVKFPATFPLVGAVVIGYQGSTSRPTNEHGIAGDKNFNTAVSNIVSHIDW